MLVRCCKKAILFYDVLAQVVQLQSRCRDEQLLGDRRRD
jgi:hypothetical protein